MPVPNVSEALAAMLPVVAALRPMTEPDTLVIVVPDAILGPYTACPTLKPLALVSVSEVAPADAAVLRSCAVGLTSTVCPTTGAASGVVIPIVLDPDAVTALVVWFVIGKP